MKAVVFGTGRIACGVVGELLDDAGCTVTFIGRNRGVVDNLNRHGRYHLRLSDADGEAQRTIAGVEAIHLANQQAAITAVTEADVIFTAVGAGNLDAVAAVLAVGLILRTSPVDVVACENHSDPGGRLHELVSARAVEPNDVHRHGFAGALVGRAVSSRLGDVDGHQPLTFVGDPIRELIVDGAVLRNPLPSVGGLHSVGDFAEYMQRKLFIFSAGHATAAYLGHLKGYRYIHAAVRDHEIREAVLEAMREGQYGIAARFGEAFACFDGPPRHNSGSQRRRFDLGRRGDHVLDGILTRFGNAALCDPVSRVGRDARRKLNIDDRLLGAAQLARRAGVNPSGLLIAAAAALCFECIDDPGTAAIRASMHQHGVAATLDQECGIGARSRLTRSVHAAWIRLTAGDWHAGNAMLSIDRPQWAWQG